MNWQAILPRTHYDPHKVTIGSEWDNLIITDLIWDGQQFVATSQWGSLLTSTDGENWSEVANFMDWEVVGAAYNGKKYIVVGTKGDEWGYQYSQDGI